jgi:hypothetical protein
MYESPRLVPITTINAAYGHGAMTMGLCVVNVNAAANANAAVNANVAVNAAAAVNVAAGVNAAAAANAVAVVLVVNHYTPHGEADPRNEPAAEIADASGESAGAPPVAVPKG